MKDKLDIIVMSVVLAVSVSYGGTGLSLNADANLRSVRLGDQIQLTLKVTGDAITNIVSGTEGAKPRFSGAEDFRSSFTFIPEKEGECIFGPYALSFNGQTLTSQPLTIRVLPKWDGAYGVFFRIDRNRIPLGEDVELIQETFSPERLDLAATRSRIKKSANVYEFSLGGTSSSVTFSSSERKSKYTERQVWRIKPTNSGVFEITGDLFESLPEGVTPPNFSVIVDEGAQHQPAP